MQAAPRPEQSFKDLFDTLAAQIERTLFFCCIEMRKIGIKIKSSMFIFSSCDAAPYSGVITYKLTSQ